MKRVLILTAALVTVACVASAELTDVLIKRALNGNLPTGSISTDEIADDAVTAPKIAEDAVGNSELADDAVSTTNVIDGSLVGPDFAANSITDTNLVEDSVGNSELADDSVSTTNVIDNTLTTDDLAADSVGNSELADDAATTTNILDGTLEGADINNGADGTVVAAVGSAAETATFAKRTTITFTNATHTATDGSDEGESLKIFDAPDGALALIHAVANITVVSTVGPTNTFVCSVGSAAAGDDNALTGTEANIVPSTAIDTTAGAVRTNAFDAVLAAPVTLDGTATAVDWYLNMAIDDDDMEVTFTTPTRSR